MSLGRALLVDSLHDSRLKEDARDGIKALVELYYREFTQATELEPAFYNALTTVIESLFDSDFDTDWLHRLINEVHETLTGTPDCDGGPRPPFTTYETDENEG